MADDPADRVHLAEVSGAFLLGQARQPAAPLAAREAELLDYGMRHWSGLTLWSDLGTCERSRSRSISSIRASERRPSPATGRDAPASSARKACALAQRSFRSLRIWEKCGWLPWTRPASTFRFFFTPSRVWRTSMGATRCGWRATPTTCWRNRYRIIQTDFAVSHWFRPPRRSLPLTSWREQSRRLASRARWSTDGPAGASSTIDLSGR